MEYETLITDMEVRPYECDLQGIVNNSIYQNYFEYARYLYLKKYFNIDFAELGVKGKNIVVHRAEIDYKKSLRSGEKFYIKSEIEIVSKIKMLFKQNIYRKEDDKIICCGMIYGVCLNENGRPVKLSDYGF
jgi:acyl-CoA thioester hydrolase